jgi:tetratricopeptide (TPR) repeat protein
MNLRSHFVLAFCLMLAGCATSGSMEALRRNSDLPRNHELVNTPFFPQELYQCGPAALATVLTARGIRKIPEELESEVYIPARQGSLQVEMLAAARKHGVVPVIMPPDMENLLREVAAGNPVLVLQNLALSWFPSWHYAVVIGYDLDERTILLRSGTTRREKLSFRTFEKTWARSNRWGFVALKPGEVPAMGEPEPMIRALLDFEKKAPPGSAEKAYEAAVRKWPANLVLLMGWGNTAYANGRYQTAQKAFRQAISAHPQSAAAYNNLAHAQLALGQVAAARDSANEAMRLAGDNAGLKAQISDTLKEIGQAGTTRRK